MATVTGTSNTAVNWLAGGIAGGNSTVGTINSSGVYIAPSTVPTLASVTITAVLQSDSSKSGSAQAIVNASNNNQRAQSLPIQLGTSGGNADDHTTTHCCGGTLGSLLIRNGTYYILSNNHVLARSDQASLGEPITQPGLIDTQCLTAGTNTVAALSFYPSLQAPGNNVDAAIAQIETGAVDLSGNILALGATATGGTPDAGPPHQGRGIPASVGEGVAKSGRTSGLTCSSIESTSLATSVDYAAQCNGPTSFTVTYTNQIAVTGGSFSIGGDSGSLIVDENTADPVALLYGGSDTETVGNPVADVLAALTDGQGNQPSFVGSASTHAVIGCTLAANAVRPANAAAQTTAPTPITPEQFTLARHAVDMHAPELLANPYVYAVGVAASNDRPGDAAVLLVVNPGQPAAPLPTTLEGVATRIISAEGAAPHGILSAETASRIAPALETFAVSGLSKSEMERAKAVHAAHVAALMKQPGVQGVGITSSANAPGEAALMIYLIRGAAHGPIPVVIDGLRTRVKESSRFRGTGWGQPEPAAACGVPSNSKGIATSAGDTKTTPN